MAPVPIWPPGKRPSVMVRRCVWSRYLPHLLLWRPALQSKEHSCDSSPCLSTNSCLNPTFKYFLPVSMKEAPSIPFELCPEACPVRQLCPVWLLPPPPLRCTEVHLIALCLLGSSLTWPLLHFPCRGDGRGSQPVLSFKAADRVSFFPVGCTVFRLLRLRPASATQDVNLDSILKEIRRLKKGRNDFW